MGQEAGGPERARGRGRGCRTGHLQPLAVRPRAHLALGEDHKWLSPSTTDNSGSLGTQPPRNRRQGPSPPAWAGLSAPFLEGNRGPEWLPTAAQVGGSCGYGAGWVSALGVWGIFRPTVHPPAASAQRPSECGLLCPAPPATTTGASGVAWGWGWATAQPRRPPGRAAPPHLRQQGPVCSPHPHRLAPDSAVPRRPPVLPDGHPAVRLGQRAAFRA